MCVQWKFRLAIICNTDDDFIARTVESIGVPIGFAITAQQAQAYKPDHRLFRHAYAAMRVTPDQLIHVGMEQVTDLKVSHEMGIQAVLLDGNSPTSTVLAVIGNALQDVT